VVPVVKKNRAYLCATIAGKQTGQILSEKKHDFENIAPFRNVIDV